jgi:hypothetical protein
MTTAVFVRKLAVRLFLASMILSLPGVALGSPPEDIVVQNQGRLGTQGDGSLSALMETASTLLSGLNLQGCVDSASSLTTLLQ